MGADPRASLVTEDPSGQDSRDFLERRTANHEAYVRILEHDLSNGKWVLSVLLGIIGVLVGVMVTLCL